MADGNPLVLENGLRQINLSGRVAKGFNCVVKAIIKKKAQIVFLSDNVDNPGYKALVTGLCKKQGVKLQAVTDKAVLGDALGLFHVKADGTARKKKACGACAILKYGNVTTPAVEEFRAAFDPPTGEAPA
jgi:small subunit ribosomal protein S12e